MYEGNEAEAASILPVLHYGKHANRMDLSAQMFATDSTTQCEYINDPVPVPKSCFSFN